MFDFAIVSDMVEIMNLHNLLRVNGSLVFLLLILQKLRICMPWLNRSMAFYLFLSHLCLWFIGMYLSMIFRGFSLPCPLILAFHSVSSSSCFIFLFLINLQGLECLLWYLMLVLIVSFSLELLWVLLLLLQMVIVVNFFFLILISCHFVSGPYIREWSC